MNGKKKVLVARGVTQVEFRTLPLSKLTVQKCKTLSITRAKSLKSLSNARVVATVHHAYYFTDVNVFTMACT